MPSFTTLYIQSPSLAATTRDKAESGSFSYDRAKSNAQFAGKNDKK